MSYQEKYQNLISKRSRNRTVDSFYSFDLPSDIVKHPNPIKLAGGTPNEGFFPIESIHLNLINEPFQHLSYLNKTLQLNKFNINTKEQIHKINETNSQHTYRYSVNDDEIPIERGLQYGETDGFPQIKKFAKDLIIKSNKPIYNDWDLIITNGSGDSLSKVVDLLVEDHGTILVEEFTFTPFNSSVHNYNATVIPVKLNIKPEDGDPGIDTEYLDDLLTNWDESEYKHLPRPTALYTIPTGQNPTALSQSLAKREKIYSIAEKHNFIIIEDDPYGSIVLPKYGTKNPYEDKNYSNDDYLNSLYPSYLRIDKSGRVLRLETFSKLFAPGLRLGFIVANKYFINRILLHTAVTTKSPSGISQLILNNIVQNWGGVDGWINWSKKIAKHYTIRRDILLKHLYETKSFEKGQFTVIEPDAGMFIILFINLEKFVPNPKNWEKILIELRLKSITNGVELVFGNRMASNLQFKHTLPKSNFIRLTVAAVDNNDSLIEGAKRLGLTIQEFFYELESGKYQSLIEY